MKMNDSVGFQLVTHRNPGWRPLTILILNSLLKPWLNLSSPCLTFSTFGWDIKSPCQGPAQSGKNGCRDAVLDTRLKNFRNSLA